MNDFGKDRFTVISDSLDYAGKHQDILANADIGIANIGPWVQYGDAHLKAIEATKYSPKMKYYVAGGYPYSNYGNDNKKTWHKKQKSIGEDNTIQALTLNRFFVVNKVDGHNRGLMNCAKTFIAKR